MKILDAITLCKQIGIVGYILKPKDEVIEYGPYTYLDVISFHFDNIRFTNYNLIGHSYACRTKFYMTSNNRFEYTQEVDEKMVVLCVDATNDTFMMHGVERISII